jgi:uncharacterized membrane protein YphA (DoxX/SURF4 family)
MFRWAVENEMSPVNRRPRGNQTLTNRMSVCFVAALGVLACPAAASAHEKWFFVGRDPPAGWDEVLESPSSFGVLTALIVTIVAGCAWRWRGGRFYALVPLILGVHLAVPLIVLGVQGKLFSPNNELRSEGIHLLIGVTEIGIGISLLYGGLTRVSALALAVVWLAGIAVAGLEPMLENCHVLGFAAFFWMTGRGPYAIDRLLFPALEPRRPLVRQALIALRVATGMSIVVVAFTEKLANRQLARRFLAEHPLNFTAALGYPLSNDAFIVCAGTAELLIGLLLVFGFFPRVVIAACWLVTNMTLTIFSWEELIGHLPLYGVMAVLLVWVPAEEDLQMQAISR